MSDRRQYVAITQDSDFEGYPRGNPQQAFGPSTDQRALSDFAHRHARRDYGNTPYVSILALMPVEGIEALTPVCGYQAVVRVEHTERTGTCNLPPGHEPHMPGHSEHRLWVNGVSTDAHLIAPPGGRAG